MSKASKAAKKLLAKLNALQCHFTWSLDPKESKLLRLRDKLEDVGSEEGNRWLGHIYNLRGFIQHKLGLHDDAQRLFNQAAEAFHRMRPADQGPWLVVNYGNLAWLHHHLGDQEQSQAYLSQVDALMEKYPPPSQGELHAEVCAEKAWTLMKFGEKKKEEAAECFEKAVSMRPDMVEWNSSHIIGLVQVHKHSSRGVETDLLRRMRQAKDQDPENLYLAALYLMHLGRRGEEVAEKARQLGGQILRRPVSSYSGIKPILRVYSQHVPIDEAVDLAEEALKKHPEERYLKRCAALCYKWKILFHRDSCPRPGMMDRAISLHREVISLYPHSSFVKKMDLASIYARSTGGKAKAEQIFQKLLRGDLQPAEKQVLYHHFAKHLHFNKQDHHGSIQFHMRAAGIPVKSFYRDESIAALRKIKDTTVWNRRSKDIEEFLVKLEA
ncbi:antiviral innate immune response effector IFIT1-like [Halichoeres trimaculatus]|uniref:antiviral innate immune response effector IFIT1-like n=1 Tax=Halichoeres trimaculatus TaxID=147232 RepID=UPI003D9F2D81